MRPQQLQTSSKSKMIRQVEERRAAWRSSKRRELGSRIRQEDGGETTNPEIADFKMKVLFMNARGINGKKKQERMLNIVERHKIDVLELNETKLT